MLVHILNKVWEQKLGYWDTNTLPYRGIKVSIKLCIGGGAHTDSQVDINRLPMHVHILIKVCDQKQGDCDKQTMPHRVSCFHQTIHRGQSRHGQLDLYKFMY